MRIESAPKQAAPPPVRCDPASVAEKSSVDMFEPRAKTVGRKLTTRAMRDEVNKKPIVKVTTAVSVGVSVWSWLMAGAKAPFFAAIGWGAVVGVAVGLFVIGILNIAIDLRKKRRGNPCTPVVRGGPQNVTASQNVAQGPQPADTREGTVFKLNASLKKDKV